MKNKKYQTKKPGLIFLWLPVPVSIDSTEVNATNETLLDYPNISHEIILNDEERARMVNYFNVLIEMDYLQKK